MTLPNLQPILLRRFRLLPLLSMLSLVLNGENARAATIQEGDVTAVLGPTFFVDDAALGGTDTDINQPAVFSFVRLFNGLLTPNQGPTRVVLTGFGFATHTSATANDATSIAVTFTYLGADEAIGGGDDVVIGTSTGTFTFSGGKEYVFAFDTPLSADLTITGTRFRIQIAPSNATNNGSLKLKSAALASEPSVNSAKLSVAGVTAPLISPGRVNLAKFQPVTASSVNGQRLASYVTDGLTGNDNRWESANWQWNTARLDFPFPVKVGSAQVFTGVDDAQAVSNFSIQYLDGTTWTTIPGASVSGNTNVERNLVFTNPITATSFRLIGQDAPLRIRELALYPPDGPGGFPLGTDLTVNLAYQRPSIASAHTTGNFPLKAVDGRTHTGSFWQTTTAGTNTLDIDLRVNTRIGSAHLYSGSPEVSPLPDFILKYWDGSTWQNITGGTVVGNTTADLVVPFTPVTTSKVRLEFTNPGTTSIRELQIFPANSGNTGYPLGTNINPSGAVASYDQFHDAYYQITNPASGRFIAMASGGQPALDQAGLTTAQGQYQVLLNLSNGTCRLRNRSTGNCLSGAQLSKTPGLPLTDAPYSAMPHQDWILDPLGGGAFQLINQWSGLALDIQGGTTAAGTPLVQNTANGSASQRWKPVGSASFPKKGVGGGSFVNSFKANWMYNWGLTTSAILPAGAVFHPMQWGDYNWNYSTSAASTWKLYPTWRASSQSLHLMGFNEPDTFSQSGSSLDSASTNEADFSPTRSMQRAVELWPRLQAMDLPLVSPCPANMTGGWLSSFYTQANALGYRVDYTAKHTYESPANGSSDNLINGLQTGYTTWGRPMWLTEFSFVDWGKNQSWSEEDNYNCLAEFLWRAESLPWLRKYALFVFTEDANNPQPATPWSTSVTTGGAPRSNSRDINGNLTAFGKLYAAWDCDATVRTDRTYYVHNKNTRKRLANLLAAGPNARSIRVDDNSVGWTLVSTGTANRYHVVSSRDGRRMSNVGGTISLAAANTSGTAVEWSLTEDQHGWYYLNHPSTSTRLQLSYNNSTSTATYTMVANSNTGDAAKWRFIVPPPPPVWSGATDTNWTAANNWIPGVVPSSGDPVSFESASIANLDTVLDQDSNLSGISLSNPAGPVSINGTNTLTLGGGGLDLAAATQNLTITAPLVMSAAQNWSVAAGRVLNIDGGVTGAFQATVTGAGTVSLGGAVDPLVPLTIASGGTLKTSASGVLASGAGAVTPAVSGILDLNGTSQSVNTLTGSGMIDNTAVGTAQLTVGNNDVAVTLHALLRNTGGSLSLVKTGAGSLTLPSPNTHSGGLTNNGSGNVVPQNHSAFGTGPVVMNGATIYQTAASYTFANALVLNGATLRVGGGGGKTILWDGPVTITGNSFIQCDGGTGGITLSAGVHLDGGTLNSAPNGTANTISGPISGTGTVMAATFSNGTLNLNAANPFAGTFRSALGTLKLGDALAMQNGTLDMNAADSGGVNLNNLNAVIGALAGTRNLGLGTGTVSIGNNHASTSYGGVLSGTGALVKTGTGTLTLAGANSYAGATGVNAGTLALGADNVLPDTALALGSATLDAATFSDTVGTLAVTGNATLNLGTGATLAFAASNEVPWSGTLNITGTFVSGQSLRFGANAGALLPAQLAQITVNGGGSFTLNSTGHLITAITDPYDLWKTQITNGRDGRTQDADDDGFTNLQEFLFGTPPVSSNGALVTASASGGHLVLRWLQREAGATYSLKQSPSLEAQSWTTVAPPGPAMDADQTGAPADYDYHTVTLPTTNGGLFFRIEGVEN